MMVKTNSTFLSEITTCTTNNQMSIYMLNQVPKVTAESSDM